MKNKKSNKIFQIFLIISFAIFVTIYISNKYGYYDYKKREQVVLTQEQIKQFESDIKDGKDVLLDSYIPTKTSYQTSISKFGLKISNFLANSIKKSVDSVFSYIGKQVENN